MSITQRLGKKTIYGWTLIGGMASGRAGKKGQGKCGFSCLPGATYKNHTFDEVLFDCFLEITFQYFSHGKIFIT